MKRDERRQREDGGLVYGGCEGKAREARRYGERGSPISITRSHVHGATIVGYGFV